VVLPAAELVRLVEAGLERAGRLKDYRSVLRHQLVALAWRSHLAKASSNVTDREGLEADARGAPELKVALDKMWPNLTASGVLRRLYGHRPTRSTASEDVLTPGEAELLARKPASRLAEEPWTRADLALLDEAEAVISGVSRRYGHIVVDEAQDLSAMELRMIGRRSRSGSMTVLGDLAQATAPGARHDWNDALGALGAPRARCEELSIGYRVPEPILAYANRLLPEVAPRVRPSTSVRRHGSPPRVLSVPRTELAHAVAAEVRALSRLDTSIGVVVTASVKEGVASALASSGVEFVDGQLTLSLGDRVTLVPPSSTKGVEFDAVVVVEPARIIAEEDGGLRLFYVVLTRAVQHLSVLHAEDLPVALTT
jgi:DNA helicase IV